MKLALFIFAHLLTFSATAKAKPMVLHPLEKAVLARVNLHQIEQLNLVAVTVAYGRPNRKGRPVPDVGNVPRDGWRMPLGGGCRPIRTT
jgi:hypothetical protein